MNFLEAKMPDWQNQTNHFNQKKKNKGENYISPFCGYKKKKTTRIQLCP